MSNPGDADLEPGRLAGLFAAVVTPLHDSGRVDLETLDRLVDLAVAAGASGICVAGATGEYPHFGVADRVAVMRRAAARLPRDRALLVGIGAPSMCESIELGEAARTAGCRALLLPMPMFFRYEQADLAAFCSQVTRTLRAPCLLYNLPPFTNGLSLDTMIALLRDEEFIVGVKDSSGESGNLAALVEARARAPWSLLVGDDRLLAAGLGARWDGGISGVAGFCPELVVALHQSVGAARADETARLQRLLDELIARIAVFPTPWGIRIGLAARGIPNGPLPLPLTANRQRQIADFSGWFPAWLRRTGLVDALRPDAREPV